MGSAQSKPTASPAPTPIQADAPPPTTETASQSTSGGGCPMKNADGSYRTMPGFASLFGRHPPVDPSPSLSPSTTATETITQEQTPSECPVRGPSRSAALSLFSRPNNDNSQTQQYDVYSRPIPIDPSNNMPLPNTETMARNILPSPAQTIALPTERVSSTIPKGGSNGQTTWTYPSPQMFWNSLARKGKLGDTKESDMEMVVAIHNSMNEGTWGKVLEWEGVVGEEGGKAELSRFTGRPSDLSPKAFLKHHLLSHPLPFDRHDWTILRPSGKEVRYVIDYYHDPASETDDTTIEDLQIGKGGKVNSLLVDVRPAMDGVESVWGRLIGMPLARRGCAGIMECVLGGGEGNGIRSEFEPLPLMPSETVKQSMDESRQVWENIQQTVRQSKGEAEACDSSAIEETVSKADATKIAESYATILKDCNHIKTQLKNCGDDAECQKAFMGMTVCAGKVMCPLQHKSFVEALEGVSSGQELDEMANSKINIAFETLGECVAGSDRRASVAKKQHPELFEKILGK